MDSQVRTAKAVVDIDEIHFLKHSAVGGSEPEITSDLLGGNSQPWFSVATLKGSVEVTQDELSKTMIHIDQSSMPIGISTEAGDFNINFFMPDMKNTNLAKWLRGETTAIQFGDLDGYGYDVTEELESMVVAIKAKTGEWFVFPNVQGAVTMAQEDKVWGTRYNGAVLGASNEKNNDIYIFADPKTTTGGSGTGE